MLQLKSEPTFLRAARVAGVILGLFFVFCGIFAGILASDAESRPSFTQLLVQRCFFIIAAVPLLIRWRHVSSPGIRRLLLVVLAGDAAYFSVTSVTSVLWALPHGEPVQITAFIVTGFCITLTLFAQFPAVARLNIAPEPNVD